jgi:hypothetical protein
VDLVVKTIIHFTESDTSGVCSTAGRSRTFQLRPHVLSDLTARDFSMKMLLSLFLARTLFYLVPFKLKL